MKVEVLLLSIRFGQRYYFPKLLTKPIKASGICPDRFVDDVDGISHSYNGVYVAFLVSWSRSSIKSWNRLMICYSCPVNCIHNWDVVKYTDNVFCVQMFLNVITYIPTSLALHSCIGSGTYMWAPKSRYAVAGWEYCDYTLLVRGHYICNWNWNGVLSATCLHFWPLSLFKIVHFGDNYS